LIAQVPFATSDVAQVFDCVKPLPLIATATPAMAAVLFTVIVCAAVAVPTTPANDSDVGEAVSGEVPVPDNAIVAVNVPDVTVAVAVAAPTAAGLKLIVNVQVPAALSAAVPQVEADNTKLDALVPLNATVGAAVVAAELVIVTVLAALVAPHCVAAKPMDVELAVSVAFAAPAATRPTRPAQVIRVRRRRPRPKDDTFMRYPKCEDSLFYA